VKEQADTLLVEALQNTEQVGERSTKPVNGPRRDHIELFCIHRLHHRVHRHNFGISYTTAAVAHGARDSRRTAAHHWLHHLLPALATFEAPGQIESAFSSVRRPYPSLACCTLQAFEKATSSLFQVLQVLWVQGPAR
jgi:hypothetical protein